jgi:uncharacterized membrane protein YciS (DUF1049 family)
MTYFLTIITATVLAVVSFVVGMVYFNYVAAWSDASRADILVIFISGFFSAWFFSMLYMIYEWNHKSYRRTRIRKR